MKTHDYEKILKDNNLSGTVEFDRTNVKIIVLTEEFTKEEGIREVLAEYLPCGVLLEIRNMKKYWIGFILPRDKAEFFEMHSPWWVSGEDEEGDSSVCCAVKSSSKDNAMEKVCSCFDDGKVPFPIIWRFVEERPDDWTPFNSRFPLSDWMRW